MPFAYRLHGAGPGRHRLGQDWADDATVARELQDCNAQANAALATEQGINADINATLGRNWQLGGTQAVQTQSMRRQAAGYADQVLNSCMRAKGFVRQS